MIATPNFLTLAVQSADDILQNARKRARCTRNQGRLLGPQVTCSLSMFFAHHKSRFPVVFGGYCSQTVPDLTSRTLGTSILRNCVAYGGVNLTFELHRSRTELRIFAPLILAANVYNARDTIVSVANAEDRAHRSGCVLRIR
jgi:hypothetical protein